MKRCNNLTPHIPTKKPKSIGNIIQDVVYDNMQLVQPLQIYNFESITNKKIFKSVSDQDG